MLTKSGTVAAGNGRTASTPFRLEAHALRKRFGTRRAVDGVDLSVGEGEIVGLLGPNGAGKTVTFYMISGMLQPDSGAITIGGDDVTNLPMASVRSAASGTSRRNARSSAT